MICSYSTLGNLGLLGVRGTDRYRESRAALFRLPRELSSRQTGAAARSAGPIRLGSWVALFCLPGSGGLGRAAFSPSYGALVEAFETLVHKDQCVRLAADRRFRSKRLDRT